MKRIKFQIWPLFSVCVCVLAAPQGADRRARQEIGPSLLKESYALGDDFVPAERAFHLFYLADTASRVAPKLSSPWANELFQLTFRLAPSWNRVALQKNALIVMARSDPAKAFQLLGKVDADIPPDGAEDLRAHGARSVFAAYWKLKGDVSAAEIRREARHIGDTGLYPFGATAPIIGDLLRKKVEEGKEWFQEAISYRRRGSLIKTADTEFSELLNAIWDVLPGSLRQEALDAAISGLEPKAKPEEGSSYRARTHSGKSFEEFDNRQLHILYDLLPKVRETNQALAAQLIRDYPVLAHAQYSKPPEFSEEVVIRGIDETPEGRVRAASVEHKIMERQRLWYIQKTAKSDSAAALQAANGFSDPAVRAEAFSIIAGIIGPRDHDRARKLIQRAYLEVDRITDRSEEIRALASVSEAAVVWAPSRSAQLILKRGLDLGVEMFGEFAETHPATPAYQALFLRDFGRLTRAAVRANPEETIAYMHGIQNNLLRAYLLMYGADRVTADD